MVTSRSLQSENRQKGKKYKIETDLDTSLRQLRPLRQLLTGVHVRVMCPLKAALQAFQLLSSEGGPGTTLLALQWYARLRFAVRLIAVVITVAT